MKDHQRSEWLQTEHTSVPCDIFGEPEKKTRIGDEYQANIPPFIPTSEDSNSDVQNQVKADKEILKDESSWSVIECHTFLLGLYMFGKNLCLVSKFMGNKGMGNVLSYYYGKFYESKEHKNWSKCRRNRSKKYVPGKKVFSGRRQQKLFSRLFPHVTDECKQTLTEASYMFKDGKLSLEKYVFKIRDMVGVKLFLEALAIGEGNRDLTSAAEMPRENKKLHPSCSSLNTEEIINLLKDRIGLSTSRLNDLFWDAVWPRLLSRGWHSEFPMTTNFASQNTKNSLVFLIPGIKKFSRRGLKKGSEYFESVTDVLNKVASKPELLEPEPLQNQSNDIENEQDSMELVVMEPSLVGLDRVLTMNEVKLLSVSNPTNKSTPEGSQNEEIKNTSSLCDEQLDFVGPRDATTDQQISPNNQNLTTKKRSSTEEALEGTTSKSKSPKKRKPSMNTALVASYTENEVAGVV